MVLLLQVGVVPTQEAQQRARLADLDLVRFFLCLLFKLYFLFVYLGIYTLIWSLFQSYERFVRGTKNN
jgi:hypothetical protein